VRRLLTAAALGFGLLSAGGLTSAASANPYGHAAGERPSVADAMIAPVHYERGFRRHGPYRSDYARAPASSPLAALRAPRYYHPPRNHPSYGWHR
jgi:hypothetical protein